MKRAVLLAVPAALVLAASASASEQKTMLNGSVGPGFVISLKKGTAKVTKLKPGAYVIRVSDKSDFHNFHLTGPGVNKRTSVAFTGTKSFSVTLKKGTYRFVCDPHSTQMKGSFTVG
jgi:plastocyanin